LAHKWVLLWGGAFGWCISGFFLGGFGFVGLFGWCRSGFFLGGFGWRISGFSFWELIGWGVSGFFFLVLFYWLISGFSFFGWLWSRPWGGFQHDGGTVPLFDGLTRSCNGNSPKSPV